MEINRTAICDLITNVNKAPEHNLNIDLLQSHSASQIGSNHILLHKETLVLLTQLFERPFEELDVLVRVSSSKFFVFH